MYSQGILLAAALSKPRFGHMGSASRPKDYASAPVRRRRISSLRTLRV